MRHIHLTTIRVIFLLERDSQKRIKELASLMRYNLLQKTEVFSKESVEMSRRKNYRSLEKFMVDFYREFRYGEIQIIDAIDYDNYEELKNSLKYYKIEYKDFSSNGQYELSFNVNKYVQCLYKEYLASGDIIIDSFKSLVKAEELLSSIDLSFACDDLNITGYDSTEIRYKIGEDKILARAQAIVMELREGVYECIYKKDLTKKCNMYDFFSKLIIKNCPFKPRMIHFYNDTISVRGDGEYKVYSIKKIKENLRLWQ